MGREGKEGDQGDREKGKVTCNTGIILCPGSRNTQIYRGRKEHI